VGVIIEKMSEVLPVFKSQYSLGRSILTLENPNDVQESGPDSIVKISQENDLKQTVIVDDSMTGFLQAYRNFQDIASDLVFGLRLTVCPDIEEKSEDSIKKSCKYLILCKNTDGYKRLIKISSIASKDGFYYNPRIDFKNLKDNWSNKDLLLVVPFYDSFIFYNSLTTNICVPDLNFTDPVFFEEDNDLPFDDLISCAVKDFTKSGSEYQLIKTKSIFYKNKKDFKSYLTFRCINNRSTLDKPQLDHMSSDEFCFESWEEQNNG
tara:strand:- start:17310 stop:18101 length:792 start_codon:yes stop_codon:yes gene_type:complete